jgi:hypothetical protein
VRAEHGDSQTFRPIALSIVPITAMDKDCRLKGKVDSAEEGRRKTGSEKKNKDLDGVGTVIPIPRDRALERVRTVGRFSYTRASRVRSTFN